MRRSHLRAIRESTGLTQSELASRAGVSRQLVGAVEAGRHLPRVDAALAIAAVLRIDVRTLFTSEAEPVDIVSGDVPQEGSLVRAGSVGERTVSAPVRAGSEGWDVADGQIEQGALTSFGLRTPGLVVAGCEPGLQALERMLREGGMGAVAATTSSASAIAAMMAGRAHVAVIHGPEPGDDYTFEGLEVERIGLARWRVGLAEATDAAAGWWHEALTGRVPVIQREQGAGVQRAFESAVDAAAGMVPGPRVASHLEAARRASLLGIPAVTIEPAALAMRASFHPLEVHEAQLCIPRQWLDDRSVAEALNVISGLRFQRRLSGVGGYDLTICGSKAA